MWHPAIDSTASVLPGLATLRLSTLNFFFFSIKTRFTQDMAEHMAQEHEN